MSSRALRHGLGWLLLAAALGSILSVIAAQSASLHHHTSQTFLYLGQGWSEYLERWDEPWVSRIGSTALGYWATDAPTVERFSVRVGWWVALWFVAISALWIGWLADWRLRALAMLANFSAITFAYLPVVLGGEATRIYPWDLPALFFMTLALLLIERSAPLVISALVVFVGMFMKETVGIVFLLPLARKQVRAAIFLLGAAVVGRVLAKTITGWQPGFVELVGYCSPQEPNALRIWYNLRYCLQWEHAFHPLFTNAGWLLAAPLFMKKSGRPMLLLLAGFAALTLLCGVIHEYRIWLEAMPMALLLAGLGRERELLSLRGDPTIPAMSSIREDSQGEKS